MYEIFIALNLELFGTVDSGANATVSQGSMGALDETGAYKYPNTDLSPEMKVYYDKTLLNEASAALVHDQFGQKRPIPKNGGKTIEFRKFQQLEKALTPISEGVTPKGNTIRVTAVTATCEQHGDFVSMTDVLQLTSIDPVLVETTKMLGSQAGRTSDTITRNVINSGMNVSFASKWDGTNETVVNTREELDKTAVLKVDTILQAVAKLRAQNAPTINGDYVAIIHPYVSYDLMRDPEWIDAHKYATPENIYKGEIGKIGGVRFVESSEAKIFAPAIAFDSTGKRYGSVTVKNAISSASASVVIDEVLPNAAGVEIPVVIGQSENNITAITTSGGVTTITLETPITASKGDKIVADGGASDDSAVFSTLVLGKDAYGVTEIEGGGLKTIVKQLGSAGSADPLDQRSSVGWKLIKTAEILLPQYIVRIESCSSKFSADAKEN